MICLFVMRGRSKRDGGCDEVFDEACDGACDSVTELCGARPELIMTGPGAVTHYQPGPGSVLPSLSSPRWCVMYRFFDVACMWVVYLPASVPNVQESKHSKQFASQMMLRLKTGDCCCWLNTTSSVGRACVSVAPWSVDYNITPGTHRHASPAHCRHHSTLNGRILYLFSQPLSLSVSQSQSTRVQLI